MNYKVGDRVKIKTWKEMKKEFGLSKSTNSILVPDETPFIKGMEKRLNRLNINRILTIGEIKIRFGHEHYHMKEIRYWWTKDMIKCLIERYKEPEPIRSRFEILDI